MKRILSIDGGGIRGLIPGMLLAEIEQRTGKRIASCFDLIAGTSTGGILALGLACPDAQGARFAAQELTQIYAVRGREIFPRSLWNGLVTLGGVAEERYNHKPLEKLLKEYFEGCKLHEARTRVLISSYDIEAREPVFFKSWRDEFAEVPMWAVARATSAAPTYFEPSRFEVDGQTRSLIDGGVFVNNPSVCAYAEARKLWPGEEVFVLSLGTGELTRPIPHQDACDWGMAKWVTPVLSCMFDGVSDAADYQLRQILGDSFLRLQTRLDVGSDDMDDATFGNIENLKLEAQRLMRAKSAELDRACALLGR
jgi:hypothetical protein